MADYDVALVARIPAVSGPPQFVEIGPIKHSGFSWTDALDGGTADVAAKISALDPDVTARLREIDRTPNEIWIHRDGVRVFAGPVFSYQVQERKTITLHAADLTWYLDLMVRDSDYSATGVDQATIVKQLIDDHQAAAYGHFGLDTTIPETGVPRDLSILAREAKKISSAIASMGGRSDGFDLSIDPESRLVMLHSPRRGVDRSATVILDRRNITKPQVTLSIAVGLFAPRVFAVSTAVTGESLTSSAVDSAAEARFGRVMVGQSFSDISEQETLDAHAARTVEDLGTPAFVAAPEVVPVSEFDVGDFGPGDQILYDYDIGLGAQSLVRRVDKVTTSVQKGRERMQVTFL